MSDQHGTVGARQRSALTQPVRAREPLRRRAVTLGVLGALVAGVSLGSRGAARAGVRPPSGGVVGGDGLTAVGSSARVNVSRAGVSRAGASRDTLAAAADPSLNVVAEMSPSSSGAHLPRGGRTLFPRFRLVGFCGAPGSTAFGRLGIGALDDRVREVEAFAVQYATATSPALRRQPMPVLELIAVVAQPYPGDDGLYRVRVDPTVIESYLAVARRHRALLLLNVQPGRARFLDEVRVLGRWLAEPDVGLALDPEWAVRAPDVPGQVFGQTSGAELDAVAGYLAGVIAAGGLPEKAMVVHQLAPSIVSGWNGLRAHPGVVVIKSVDGIGPPQAKLGTWLQLVRGLPRGVRPGFKLFFAEDVANGSRLMTPAEVLALRPPPDYVLYE